MWIKTISIMHSACNNHIALFTHMFAYHALYVCVGVKVHLVGTVNADTKQTFALCSVMEVFEQIINHR